MDLQAFIDGGVGSITQRSVKVAKRVWATVFVFGATDSGIDFEIATAEPRKHLLVTVVTPDGQKPLPYLKAMLEAGLGKPAS